MPGPAPDSDTDPDMPEMVEVQVEVTSGDVEPVKMIDPRTLGHSQRWCLERANLDAYLERTNLDAQTEKEKGKRTALGIINRLEESDRNKNNLMWRLEDPNKNLDTHAPDPDEVDRWVPSRPPDKIHTVPGGLAGATKASCARIGCGKPSRGTGGTSKYCSLACLDADDDEDSNEDKEVEESVSGAQTACETQTVDRGEDRSLDSAPTDSGAQKVGVGIPDKRTAMSPEAFDANLQKSLPVSGLIFLDVDGVLNATSDGPCSACEEVITSTTPMMILNRRCLKRLVSLVHETDARLVLSSTWRVSAELKADLWEALVAAGLQKEAFIGQTPVINFSLRNYEIKEWLDKHLDKLGADSSLPWVVIDDMPLGRCPELKGHFVRTDPSIGFSEKDSEFAAEILSACRPCCT